MSERDELNEPIMLRASELGHRLWRNNSGLARYKNDDGSMRSVKYGVANPGGSDLIGFTRVLITPAMVGDMVAVFTAIESKTGHVPLTLEQGRFLNMVRNLGGIAGEARETGAYERLIEMKRPAQPQR